MITLKPLVIHWRFLIQSFNTSSGIPSQDEVLSDFIVTLVATPALAQYDEQLGLWIAEEYRCSPYNPADYSYPQSVEDAIVESLEGVYSPYTDEWFEDDRDTDIEHIVARSEAHDSGLCSRSLAVKQAFARDLLNLTLASPRVNRQEKIDKDVTDWIPDYNRCWFANRVVEVRRKYDLTVDLREAWMLRDILNNCQSTELAPRSPKDVGCQCNK